MSQKPSARLSGSGSSPIRHVLSAEDLTRIHTAIRDAADTKDLLTGTARTIYQALATITTESAAAVSAAGYALPTSQWLAILDAATQRAQQWGTHAEVALDLAMNLMPGQYDDPAVLAPELPLPDYRPQHYQLQLDRDTLDVIADCTRHLQHLHAAYGQQSPLYQDAMRSWTTALTTILSMGTGAVATVHRDGPLSLLAHTSSGLIYAVTFHGIARRCTVTGCGAHLADDGSTDPADKITADHEHVPSYPFGGPQPGTWTLHS